MLTILVKIYEWMGKYNPMVATILTGIGVGMAVWNFFKSLWVELFARGDALAVASMPSGVDFSPLGLANYVFPLDTLCSYIVTLGALKVVCVGIRVIKSFVPTIA